MHKKTGVAFSPAVCYDDEKGGMFHATWYVLHVKPRTEKKVVEYLRSYGYFRHLPVYTKITKVQRRKVRRELPLFPGYVFTKLFPDERIKMLQTNLLVNTIKVLEPRKMKTNRSRPVLRHAL